MTSPIGVAAATTQTAVGQDVAAQASQNLFEAMAQQAQTQGHGTSPSQLSVDVLERLNGFIDRSKHFAARADALAGAPAATAGAPAQALPPTPETAGLAARTPEHRVDNVLRSLNRMFDHSIETQMVVRGATQVSGAVNTLLRGQ